MDLHESVHFPNTVTTRCVIARTTSPWSAPGNHHHLPLPRVDQASREAARSSDNQYLIAA